MSGSLRFVFLFILFGLVFRVFCDCNYIYFYYYYFCIRDIDMIDDVIEIIDEGINFYIIVEL